MAERIISSAGKCDGCGKSGNRGKDLIKQYENEQIFWLCNKCSTGAEIPSEVPFGYFIPLNLRPEEAERLGIDDK